MESMQWRRVAAGLAAMLFAVMAAIQLNDPDPLYWFPVYAGVALVMLAAAVGRRVPRLTCVVLGAVIAGMLIAAPGFLDYLQSGDWGSIGGTMSADRPHIESAREFLGLAMAGCALFVLVKRTIS